MINKNDDIVILHNLIDQIETLEVLYDGMVSDDIIDLLKQAKSQAQMDLRKAEERKK
jgi:hypothetical protein